VRGRGPRTDTRDIIQNVYMRKVEKTGGELYNIEFATFDAIKDPIKAAAKK
jgi:branched-chain amino acid transport system substrate-binding protein